MGQVKEQHLALIIGKRADLFPHQDLGSKTLHHIQFDPEHQTTICHSLQRLTSNCLLSDCKVASVLLCHLPHLITLDLPSCSYIIGQAIEILYSLIEALEHSHSREVVQGEPGDQRSLKFTLSSTLQISFNLQNLLGSVDSRNGKMLTAVDLMCPILKSIQLSNSTSKTQKNFLRPAQLHKFLGNKFSKVSK